MALICAGKLSNAIGKCREISSTSIWNLALLAFDLLNNQPLHCTRVGGSYQDMSWGRFHSRSSRELQLDIEETTRQKKKATKKKTKSIEV